MYLNRYIGNLYLQDLILNFRKWELNNVQLSLNSLQKGGVIRRKEETQKRKVTLEIRDHQLPIPIFRTTFLFL